MHSSLAEQLLGYQVRLLDWVSTCGNSKQSAGSSLAASQVSDAVVCPEGHNDFSARKQLL